MDVNHKKCAVIHGPPGFFPPSDGYTNKTIIGSQFFQNTTDSKSNLQSCLVDL